MHRHVRTILLLAIGALSALLSGCAAVPSRHVQPVFHNPFPQLHRVAVLPFYNQSREPTVDGEEVAIAYYNELQAIQGFEVMPVGVARRILEASRIQPVTGADFQELARLMRVDAVIVGSVTDYSPYYPPRLGLSVDWYAANPGFHPIPPGYGLPWGTAEEEFIPSKLVKESEFALAREQLKSQTPRYDEYEKRAQHAKSGDSSQSTDRHASHERSADKLVGGSGRWHHRQRIAWWSAAASMARSARFRSVAPQSSPAAIAPSIRTDHHAYAHLSRPGRRVYPTPRSLL
jgi:hypothetical protein